ncbi:hypothetical protein PISMIDRAFT_7393 [Pisolithus microcarpus 441]|uniref:Trehalose synthase N-terminal domain-containing protein n=1 Tax=Pisolithus microcarpus 441 TaxID=765257 RepID=A0A0C9ZSP2_9AGAM|nr:hypothetical protein PISMIDRAFT_7393 [Pisolithus microcarpus 441]
MPGTVDIAFIDDPQMSGLIPLIKKVLTNLCIAYRSHIEIHGDLVHQKAFPQEEVWEHLWKNIKQANFLISHPISKFVPPVMFRLRSWLCLVLAWICSMASTSTSALDCL